MGRGLGRRAFLTATAAVAAASVAHGQEAATARAHGTHQPTGALPETALLFLSDSEAAVLTAVVEVMVPADDAGPGGVDAGVVTYLDRQLAGAWGNGARLYLQGPWSEGTPSQGYQLPLTPGALFRAALPELDRLARDSTGESFAKLEPGRRDEILRALLGGDMALATIPGKTFVSVLHAAVIEGYLADPAYGGNRAMAAWRMIGYPGARGAYVEDIGTYRGRPYPAEPLALADLQ